MKSCHCVHREMSLEKSNWSSLLIVSWFIVSLLSLECLFFLLIFSLFKYWKFTYIHCGWKATSVTYCLYVNNHDEPNTSNIDWPAHLVLKTCWWCWWEAWTCRLFHGSFIKRHLRWLIYQALSRSYQALWNPSQQNPFRSALRLMNLSWEKDRGWWGDITFNSFLSPAI